MKFLAFANDDGIRFLDYLYKKKPEVFTPVRELNQKVGYAGGNSNAVMRQIRSDELVEYKEFSGPYPIGRRYDQDKDTYRLTNKGRKVVRALRKIKKLAESHDIL